MSELSKMVTDLRAELEEKKLQHNSYHDIIFGKNLQDGFDEIYAL